MPVIGDRDRTLEHLAPSDRMITMTRRRLIEAARALRDHGTVPPLVDNPEISGNARSGDLFAPTGQSWLEAYEQTLGQASHPKYSQAAE
jgi:phthalate 4,5-dioxygenase